MESGPLTLACNYNHNEMQKCKCLCACSSVHLWGATVASVVDDTCHTGGGRQNGDMWEREQALNRTGTHTLTKVNPITALANAPLNVLQIYTVN